MLAYHWNRQVEALAAYDFLDGLEQLSVGPQQGAVDRVTAESSGAERKRHTVTSEILQTVIEAAFEALKLGQAFHRGGLILYDCAAFPPDCAFLGPLKQTDDPYQEIQLIYVLD